MSARSRSFVICLAILCIASRAAAQDAVVTGVVTTRSDGLPVPGATVSIRSLNLSTTTTQDGRYTLTVPAARARGQRVDLQVTFSGTQSKVETITLTAGTVTHDVELELSFHEEITRRIAGTGRGGRTGRARRHHHRRADRSDRRGRDDAGDSDAGAVVQFPAPDDLRRHRLGAAGDAARPRSRSGARAVNGKRRHQTALIHINSTIGRGSTGVDLNAIPVSAIERIEILRDGAAAQYGSDAIAGVINIVLKSGASRPTVAVRAGGNVGTFNDVFGTEHDFSDGGTFDCERQLGVRARPRASLTVAGEYRNRRGTNRAGPDTGDPFSPQPNIHWGDSEEQDGLLFANAEVPLGDSADHIVLCVRRLDPADRLARRQLSPRGSTRATCRRSIRTGSCRSSSRSTSTRRLRRGCAACAGAWFWDVSGVFGHNRLDYYVRNSLNVSLGPTIPPNQTEFYAARSRSTSSR